jgi:sulfur-oxidizing protein SoxX
VQDDTQKTCSAYAGKALPKDVAERSKGHFASIDGPPAGSGDWKNGERIAQEGRGMQYSDDPRGRSAPIAMPATALARGAVLRHDSNVPVRKLRGYRVNAQMRTARSATPRATTPARTCRASATAASCPQQINDVVALLMDPDSPVNK